MASGQMVAGFGGNLSSPAASSANPLWVETISPRRAFFVIREGRRDTPRPAFKVLTEEEIWDLVAYVRGVAAEEN
jgi:mono/diheme cytochrome c family protein